MRKHKIRTTTESLLERLIAQLVAGGAQELTDVPANELHRLRVIAAVTGEVSTDFDVSQLSADGFLLAAAGSEHCDHAEIGRAVAAELHRRVNDRLDEMISDEIFEQQPRPAV